MELSRYYRNKFVVHLGRLRKRLDRYIKDPDNEKSVHDTRTSLRRVDTMYSLLPKKERDSNRKLFEKYKEFFDENSNVRDYDVMMARLAELSAAGDAKSLTDALRRKRNAEQKMAVNMARALRESDDDVRIGHIPSGKLESRINKVTGRLCESIRLALPLVLTNKSNVEELHTVRKDCKKLRYILETLPDSDERKYRSKISKALGKEVSLVLLEELQTTLGEIHDSDVMLQFLKQSKSGIARELAEKEAASREQLYQGFVRDYTSSGREKSSAATSVDHGETA